MKLVRVRERDLPAQGESPSRYGLLEDDDRLRLLPADHTFTDALAAIGDDGTGTAELETSDPAAWELLAPVPAPASVRDCVGFLQHIRNTRRSRGDVAPLPPVWSERPGFYFANPHSLRSATAAIPIPTGCEAFDFELEVAVVLAAGGRDLTAAEAKEAIAGYVLLCDWSARDIQAVERGMQVGLGKAKDAAMSLGPWVLSAGEAAPFVRHDGLDIPVGAYVNGERVTAPETRYTGMDWTFEEIVAFASVGVDLVPGEVIAAGTVPTGCLLEHSAGDGFRGWLKEGDVVRLDAGPLGEIVSPIAASTPQAQWRSA
ncbi:fumarylacetoacetate hydrolase family protein [Actinomadura welshii]